MKKPKDKAKISHCCSCGSPMPYGCDIHKYVPVCLYEACPNFGLLQIGIEAINNLNDNSLSLTCAEPGCEKKAGKGALCEQHQSEQDKFLKERKKLQRNLSK